MSQRDSVPLGITLISIKTFPGVHAPSRDRPFEDRPFREPVQEPSVPRPPSGYAAPRYSCGLTPRSRLNAELSANALP